MSYILEFILHVNLKTCINWISWMWNIIVFQFCGFSPLKEIVDHKNVSVLLRFGSFLSLNLMPDVLLYLKHLSRESFSAKPKRPEVRIRFLKNYNRTFRFHTSTLKTIAHVFLIGCYSRNLSKHRSKTCVLKFEYWYIFVHIYVEDIHQTKCAYCQRLVSVFQFHMSTTY